MPVEVWPQAELARTLSPGKELGRQGGTRPAALRLHPTPQGSAPCHLSQCLSAQDLKITFLKKKKKNPPPHRGHPSPTCMGGRGAQHVLDSWKHQEQKKRLVWSSASWSGFPRLPLPPSTVAPSAIPRRASAASLPPALISQGSGRTGAGRSGREGGGEGDRGARGPRPCSGACQSCVVFFGQALRLSVPLCSPAQGGARSMPP